MKEKKPLIECYMDLLAAVYESGRRCNDVVFLKSEWGEFIKDTVSEYAQEKQRLNEHGIKVLV